MALAGWLHLHWRGACSRQWLTLSEDGSLAHADEPDCPPAGTIGAASIHEVRGGGTPDELELSCEVNGHAGRMVLEAECAADAARWLAALQAAARATAELRLRTVSVEKLVKEISIAETAEARGTVPSMPRPPATAEEMSALATLKKTSTARAATVEKQRATVVRERIMI